MEKSLKQTIKYNSLLILTKVIIVSLVILPFNQLISVIVFLLAIIFAIIWGVIAQLSGNDFKKYFKRMRNLMMVYIIFLVPNNFKIDFNVVSTIKKNKYSFDMYWLYSYVKRRDFIIDDQENFKDSVVKEMNQIEARVLKVSRLLSVTSLLVIGLIIAGFAIFSFPETIETVLFAILSLVVIALVHNFFMKLFVYKRHQDIKEALNKGKYQKALRLTILYLGMTKRSLYKTKTTSYLRNVESEYIY